MKKYKLIYGRGQINHIRGLVDTKSRHGVMFFTRHEPGEIGRLKEVTAERLSNAPVVMIFENIDGLDVLISELNQLREEMLGNKRLNPITTLPPLEDVIDLNSFTEPDQIIDKTEIRKEGE